jgi:tetratricopeptide (TPR) repeat protein
VTRSPLDEISDALERGDANGALRLTDAILAARPGDDAAHELRARALIKLGRLAEAERDAKDAVRLDPEEIRYRELLAEVLSREGAHRDAANEFARLARNDPRQTTWTIAEARERLGAAEPGMGVEAARRAVQLDPRNGAAQLALAQGLARTGDARGAILAATRAAELLPGDPAAREAVADARWLANDDRAAFEEFAALARELSGSDRQRVTAKAQALYRQDAGSLGRIVAAIGPLFAWALGRGWLHVGR